MSRQTHKNKKGGAWFTKKPVGADEITKHNALPKDVRIGVLVSEKSLASDDSSIRGTPYVIILPEPFKPGSGERYAYGSSAADAVSRAQQRQYERARFPDDTYTGVGISSRNLVTPHPEMAKQPYVIEYTKGGESIVEYGTSPTFIKRSSIYAATRRIAGKVGSAAGRFGSAAYGLGESTLSRGRTAASAAYGLGSSTLSRGRTGLGAAARGAKSFGKALYHAPTAVAYGAQGVASAAYHTPGAISRAAQSAAETTAQSARNAYDYTAAAAAAAPAAAEKGYAYAAPKQAAAAARRRAETAKKAFLIKPRDQALKQKYLEAADFANQRARNSNIKFLSEEEAIEANTKRTADAEARRDNADMRQKRAIAKDKSIAQLDRTSANVAKKYAPAVAYVPPPVSALADPAASAAGLAAADAALAAAGTPPAVWPGLLPKPAAPAPPDPAPAWAANFADPAARAAGLAAANVALAARARDRAAAGPQPAAWPGFPRGGATAAAAPTVT